jgi:diguanylate cyclase (GGDEF)-like protein
MDYLEYGKYKNEYNTLRTFIDWQVLMKYKIDTDLIPEDVIVINKPISIVKTHFKELLIASILVITFFLLLTIYWTSKLYKINNELVIIKDKEKKLARTDQLTGINNRYAFFEKGNEVCNVAKRLHKPLSVLMIDIDHFKNINDTFGHFAGDKVIKKLAYIINEKKREIDICARIGGEEFAVLVLFSDITDAVNLAYRLHKEVNNAIIYFDSNELRFTVSIGVFGVAAYSENNSLEELLNFSDKALYQAKENGRNQVVIYDENL